MFHLAAWRKQLTGSEREDGIFRVEQFQSTPYWSCLQNIAGHAVYEVAGAAVGRRVVG
jgi:hypothetical protein